MSLLNTDAMQEMGNLIAIVTGLFIALSALAVRDRARQDFLVILGISDIPITLVNIVLSGITSLQHVRVDLYLDAIDRVFLSPANHVTLLLQSSRWLTYLCLYDYVYWWVPVTVALLILSQLDIREAWQGLFSIILSPIAAIPFYLLVPASGPGFMYSDYPAFHTEAPHLLHSSLYYPNCFPSVHFTFALLALWYLRHSNLGITIGSLHVALTTTATLGLGQHYFIDLIAALPFTLLMIRLPEWIFNLRTRNKSAWKTASNELAADSVTHDATESAWFNSSGVRKTGPARVSLDRGTDPK